MYTYEVCGGDYELDILIHKININEYQLVSVTQDSNDIYTVFYKIG